MKKALTKKDVLELLDKVGDEANLYLKEFVDDCPDGKGGYYSSYIGKTELIQFLETSEDELKPALHYNDEIDYNVLIIKNKGICLRSIYESIYYKTENVEDYIHVQSSHNKYYEVFIKINKDEKKIHFKLGNKEKILDIIEENDINSYVMKPIYTKRLKCVNIDNLLDFINDDFWTNHVLSISRKVLRIK